MTKINELFKFFVLLFITVGVSSCGLKYTEDLSLLKKYNDTYFSHGVSKLTDTVDLFVDYSTCVVEAKTSIFYNSTHPSIVDCSPVFWSIKGSEIRRETNDRQQVYQLLSTITEVNYADIKKAVRQIVEGNNQAVLITDGEYFLKGSVKDNLTNPYLSEEFRVWLRKGYDIYIFSEPYLEGGVHKKHRYYMLFTDAAKYNNIYDRFVRSASNDDSVQMLHLNNGIPVVKFSKNYPDINVSVSPISDNCVFECGYELQEYGMGWSDIKAFLDGDDISICYVSRGMFIDRTESDCYKIKEVKPVVYQVYDSYKEFTDSTYAEGKLPKFPKLKEVKNVFEIDKDIFDQTGEIVLRLHEDFDGIGDALSEETPNLLKVDIVIEDAEDNFSTNPTLSGAYMWNSISVVQNHALNTSLYESISQVIKDPTMNPRGKERVIYTLYISTSRI